MAVRCILRLTNSLYPQHDIHLLVDAVYLKHPALTRLHMQTSDSWSAAAEICSECYRTAECTLQVSRHFFFFFFFFLCRHLGRKWSSLPPTHTATPSQLCLFRPNSKPSCSDPCLTVYKHRVCGNTHIHTHILSDGLKTKSCSG